MAASIENSTSTAPDVNEKLAYYEKLFRFRCTDQDKEYQSYIQNSQRMYQVPVIKPWPPRRPHLQRRGRSGGRKDRYDGRSERHVYHHDYDRYEHEEPHYTSRREYSPPSHHYSYRNYSDFDHSMSSYEYHHHGCREQSHSPSNHHFGHFNHDRNHPGSEEASSYSYHRSEHKQDHSYPYYAGEAPNIDSKINKNEDMMLEGKKRENKHHDRENSSITCTSPAQPESSVKEHKERPTLQKESSIHVSNILDSFQNKQEKPPSESDVMAILNTASMTTNAITSDKLKQVKKETHLPDKSKHQRTVSPNDEKKNKQRDIQPTDTRKRKASANDGLVVSHGSTKSVAASILRDGLNVQTESTTNTFKPTRKKRKGIVVDDDSDEEIDPINIEADTPQPLSTTLLHPQNHPFYVQSTSPNHPKQDTVQALSRPLFVSIHLEKLETKQVPISRVIGGNVTHVAQPLMPQNGHPLDSLDNVLHTSTSDQPEGQYTAVKVDDAATKLILRVNKCKGSESLTVYDTSVGTSEIAGLRKRHHKSKKKKKKKQSQELTYHDDNDSDSDNGLKVKINVTRQDNTLFM